MELTALTALCPLDGRYSHKTESLREIMSEYGLIYYRLKVEIYWLLHLVQNKKLKLPVKLSSHEQQTLLCIVENFNPSNADHIKKIEQVTNHDVKAIEYYIRECIHDNEKLKALIPFIHFAATSEDINNLAYALMLKDARDKVILPQMAEVISTLNTMAKEYSQIPMLSRTHGQPASPTTLGKEIVNFSMRLQRQYDQFKQADIFAKFNGAVGNFNAHVSAYPQINWRKMSESFIKNLGLEYNAYTTQIEPHDYLAEILQTVARFNTILIDLSRDTWGYVCLGYFSQKRQQGEVGSSTMPHKINPIDFENAEGNLGMANALAAHMSAKLPVSRWQRDLSDSTVLRNLGCVFGYSLLSYLSLQKGLTKLTVNQDALSEDLNKHWEILAEPIQTVMRRYGIDDAYEQLKDFTRGKSIDQKLMQEFIVSLEIPADAKESLLTLKPAEYIGLAVELTHDAF